jgi:tellurite resistance protein TehA-like permease
MSPFKAALWVTKFVASLAFIAVVFYALFLARMRFCHITSTKPRSQSHPCPC